MLLIAFYAALVGILFVNVGVTYARLGLLERMTRLASAFYFGLAGAGAAFIASMMPIEGWDGKAISFLLAFVATFFFFGLGIEFDCWRAKRKHEHEQEEFSDARSMMAP